MDSPKPDIARGPLRLLFCADPGHFQNVAVAAVSAAGATRFRPLEVKVITTARDEQQETKLRTSIESRPGCSLRLHLADTRCLDDFSVSGHVSKETYLRLFAADILPDSIDRILYLDTDIVVVDDTLPLWRVDMGGDPVAAAPDLWGASRISALGLSGRWPYVNAGVLVMDLAAWRREGLSSAFAHLISRRGAAFELHDQDALNILLEGRIRIVEQRWNVQTQMFRIRRSHAPDLFPGIREARRRPAVLHYAGPNKPWNFAASTARKQDYYRVLAQTEWRGYRPTLAARKQRWEFAAGRLLDRIGLDYMRGASFVERAAKRILASTRSNFLAER